MARNNSVLAEIAVDTIAEISIPQSERDSVDNEFYVFNRAIEGPLKAAMFSKLPKGNIKITITRE